MPRTSRQHSDTGVYHVMLRGIDRQDIFADDQDRGKLHQKNRPYFHYTELGIILETLENNMDKRRLLYELEKAYKKYDAQRTNRNNGDHTVVKYGR